MRRTFLGALALVAFFLPAALAPADDGHAPAEHGHAAAGHGDAHGAHHPAPSVHGQPPRGLLGSGTEFLYPSPKLFFWTIFTFLVTATLLRYLVWNPVLHSLHQRDERIAEAVVAAKEALEGAQRLVAEHDVEIGRAHDEASQILDAARKRAAEETDAILAKAKAEASSAQEAARREIEGAKVEALAGLRSSATRLASQIIERTAKKRIEPASLAGMVQEERP